MARKKPADVLVVGAGPSGLMMADLLRRWGVSVRIIDDKDGPSVHSKALGIHARSLEALDQLGVADKAVRQGWAARGVNFFRDATLLARAPFGEMGTGITPFPFVLILPQRDTEKLLSADAKAHGAAVEWRTRLESFTETADGITATLRRKGKTETVEVGWVVGADGARSTVRRTLGIPFEGDSYEHRFYVADVTLGGIPVEGEVNLIFSDRFGFAATFPMGGSGRARVVGQVPEEFAGTEPSFEDLEGYFARALAPTLTLRDPEWFSTYRLHHLVAKRFSQGRAFLIGDAAHVHSPVGGQGMNTGLQDAYNLAWKLALVATGRASAKLLASYQAERRPNAITLVRTTDAAFTQILRRRRGWIGRMQFALFGTVAPRLLRATRFRHAAFRRISQTGITYRRGPLTHNGLRGSVRAGDRLPWFMSRGGSIYDSLTADRFTVVAVGPEYAFPGIETLSSDLVQLHRLGSSEAGPLGEGLYLVRPDGYIGATAHSAGEIQRYLADVMGITAARRKGSRVRAGSRGARR